MFAEIKALCTEKGISISELEQSTGIGNGTISRWDKSNPRVDKLKAVADYFGRTVDSFLSDKEKE